MTDMHHPRALLSRRSTLLGLAAVATVRGTSLALADAPGDRRFVVVILRGALDGLAAVVPYGDPALIGLRGGLVPKQPGTPDGLLDLGGFYGLHPAMAGLHGIYRAGGLLPVHAVSNGTGVRSHFVAQDHLELGSVKDEGITSGWLNRLAGLLAKPGATTPKAGSETALAVGPSMPLLLRGPVPVGSWMPVGGGKIDPSFYAELAAMHGADPATGPAIKVALRERGFSAEALAGMAPLPNAGAFPALCAAAGRMLAAPAGPRLAALEVGGWDTHAHQAARLPPVLKTLDDGLVALKEGLGDAWPRTVVLVVTEFGRTARINGTQGTDHGTASVAFALGGNVAGGRVGGRWPGLTVANLFENRDLQPTNDLRGVAKGLLAQHFALGDTALAGVFPDSATIQPMKGLLRA
jgi:uncharacterized protein (DUF1501 family)